MERQKAKVSIGDFVREYMIRIMIFVCICVAGIMCAHIFLHIWNFRGITLIFACIFYALVGTGIYNILDSYLMLNKDKRRPK